jgi:hypothetical protein
MQFPSISHRGDDEKKSSNAKFDQNAAFLLPMED